MDVAEKFRAPGTKT